jgi:hypothetical protein
VTRSTPLQKRIKRHVTGREHRFFAATAPGLEMVCRDELNSFLPAGIHIAAKAALSLMTVFLIVTWPI